MKQFRMVFAAMSIILGIPLLAGVSKFAFHVTYPDQTTGTIQAGVKITKNGQVTVCDYFRDPNDQFVGQFQSNSTTFSNPPDAGAVETFCLEHFPGQ